jgi:outer membrane protein assembly factor BamA
LPIADIGLERSLLWSRNVTTRSVRLIFVCLGSVACRHPQATFPAIPSACSEARVGKVIVEGGNRDHVPQLAVLEGTLDNPERTDRIASVSTELLRARGYPRAEIRVSRRQGCGVELVVTVATGPKLVIGSIAFATTDSFPADARLAAVEDALGTINTVGGAYVPDRLDRALEQLTRRYHELGWLEAAIDRPQVTFDDERGEVNITIGVRAGRRFKIGNVSARGGRRTTRAAVIDALGLRGGQYYDAELLREGIVRARREIDDRLQMRMQIASDRIDVEAIVGDEP